MRYYTYAYHAPVFRIGKLNIRSKFIILSQLCNLKKHFDKNQLTSKQCQKDSETVSWRYS